MNDLAGEQSQNLSGFLDLDMSMFISGKSQLIFSPASRCATITLIRSPVPVRIAIKKQCSANSWWRIPRWLQQRPSPRPNRKHL
jgi:hypothetical protein